jgi:hypothetical protein
MTTGELAVMDHTGDMKVIWSSDNEDEVTQARKTFDDMRAKGYAAYRVEGKKGEKGEVIREFDPAAEKIIMAPAMVGG